MYGFLVENIKWDLESYQKYYDLVLLIGKYVRIVSIMLGLSLQVGVFA